MGSALLFSAAVLFWNSKSVSLDLPDRLSYEPARHALRTLTNLAVGVNGSPLETTHVGQKILPIA